MKYCYGNFKSKLNLEQTKQLLDVYAKTAQKKSKLGFCVLDGFYDECSKLFSDKVEIFQQNLKGEKVPLFALLGHSDYRAAGETDDEVLDKIKKVFKNKNSKVVLCVGEGLKDKDNNKTYEKIYSQISDLKQFKKEIKQKRLIIAYEPVYAISTAANFRPAVCSDVVKVVDYIKKFLPGVIVLYGGSVNEATAGEFLGQNQIDGCLVGAASLNPDTFSIIIAACKD